MQASGNLAGPGGKKMGTAKERLQSPNNKEFLEELMLFSKKMGTEKERMQSLNNEEYLAELMLFSPHGSLCRTFIIEAIRYYSERVAATTPVDNSNAVIDPMAWHRISVNILKRFKLEYDK